MSIHLDADHPAIRAALAQANTSQNDSRRAVLAQNARKKEKRPKRQGKRRGSGPEQAIQNSILDYLHRRGILAWRINSGAVKAAHGGLVKLAPAGHPDIAGVYQGRALYIEVKQPGKHPNEAQQAFIDALLDAGALAFVATSIDDVRWHLEQEP